MKTRRVVTLGVAATTMVLVLLMAIAFNASFWRDMSLRLERTRPDIEAERVTRIQIRIGRGGLLAGFLDGQIGKGGLVVPGKEVGRERGWHWVGEGFRQPTYPGASNRPSWMGFQYIHIDRPTMGNDGDGVSCSCNRLADRGGHGAIGIMDGLCFGTRDSATQRDLPGALCDVRV